MSGIPNLPETFDDLPDKRRFWPGAAGSEEEGLGMLRLLTPELVAQAARTQIQSGERVCLNWNMENLSPPGKIRALDYRIKQETIRLTTGEIRVRPQIIRAPCQMGRRGRRFRRRIPLQPTAILPVGRPPTPQCASPNTRRPRPTPLLWWHDRKGNS